MFKKLQISLVFGALILASFSPLELGHAVTNAGRILSSTGSAWGGLVTMNPDAKTVIQLTPNTFGSTTKGDQPNYKDDNPSVSTNGIMVFLSNRYPAEGSRVFRANADGSAVKQLTFARDAAGRADDKAPVISPDGKLIAFVSRRSGAAASNDAQDIFIMNSDGTGLRQLTKTEQGPNSDSYIRSVVFSPDSKQVAYRGLRVVQEGSNFPLREVLGFINVDGTNEIKEVTNDCAGGHILDWVGDKILYSYGGSVQGCPQARLIVWDRTANERITVPVEQTAGLSPFANSARLSPDGKRVAYSATAALGSKLPSAIITLGIDGTDRVESLAPIATSGTWIWWSSQTEVQKPAKLVIKPASVTIKRGAKPVNLVPLLTDSKGKVLSKSVSDWTWKPGTNCGLTTISTTGVLTVPAETKTGVCIAQVSNGGKTATIRITIK